MVLFGALLMVYLDYRMRNEMIKDPFMNPIHLNLPYFVGHCVILVICIAVNIGSEITSKIA